MKRWMLSIVLVAAASAPAWAQGVPGVPGGGRCPGGENHGPEDPNKGMVWLKLRYYSPDGKAPAAWKKRLDAVKMVKAFQFDEETRMLHCKVAEASGFAASLESALQAQQIQALVVNRVRMHVGMASAKGVDPVQAKAALAAIGGVSSVEVVADGFVVEADLMKLTPEAVANAGRAGGFEPVLSKTHEFVRYKVVDGKADAFRSASLNVKGVLIASLDPDHDGFAGMWVHKGHLKKMDAVEKLAGFKVERAAAPGAPTGTR